MVQRCPPQWGTELRQSMLACRSAFQATQVLDMVWSVPDDMAPEAVKDLWAAGADRRACKHALLKEEHREHRRPACHGSTNTQQTDQQQAQMLTR